MATDIPCRSGGGADDVTKRIIADEHGLPIARACQVARLSRTAYFNPFGLRQASS